MYIDTSCLVAYYIPEERSDYVQRMIRSSELVSISYLTEIEMLSAIKKKQRMNELSADDGFQAYKLFKDHVKNRLYEFAELSPTVFSASEFILQKSKVPLRTLDAIHLGVVYEYHMELFTFDDVLLKAANEFRINAVGK